MLVIYCSDEKADFSALLLQSLVSNEPSEIIWICWFGAQEMFLILTNNVKTVMLLDISCGNCDA